MGWGLSSLCCILNGAGRGDFRYLRGHDAFSLPTTRRRALRAAENRAGSVPCHGCCRVGGVEVGRRRREGVAARQKCRPCPTTLPGARRCLRWPASRRHGVRCRSNWAARRACRSFRTAPSWRSRRQTDRARHGSAGLRPASPGHRAEHLVIPHLRFQLGADVGDNPELPVPDSGTVGVVQQDEAAGGQFDVVTPRSGGKGCRCRTVNGARTGRVSRNEDFGPECHGKGCQPRGRRNLLQAAARCGTVLVEGFPRRKGNRPEPGRVRSQWKIMQRRVVSPAGSPPARARTGSTGPGRTASGVRAPRARA